MSEHEHDCGCGHDHEHDHDHMNVTLTLDDGTDLECEVLCIFPVGEKDYIALVPAERDEEEDEEDSEIFLYQFIEHENDEIELLNIENDDEFEAVSDAFDELMDSEEFDDMFDEEEEEDEEEDEEK